MKKQEFLSIAERLNKDLHIVPLLYGSLGLEQRLQTDLNAEDIDILLPEVYLNENWEQLVALMEENGYVLYDLHEHAFEKADVRVAFASIEDLTPFAGVELTGIPVIEESGARYFLLTLQDYWMVYTASSMDGYRKTKKNKQDEQKLQLIEKALGR